MGAALLPRRSSTSGSRICRRRSTRRRCTARTCRARSIRISRSPARLAVEERVGDGRRRRARAARAPHPAQRPLGPRPRARGDARAAVASRRRPRRASRSPTRRRCRSRDSACRGGRVGSYEGMRGSGSTARRIHRRRPWSGASSACSITCTRCCSSSTASGHIIYVSPTVTEILGYAARGDPRAAPLRMDPRRGRGADPRALAQAREHAASRRTPSTARATSRATGCGSRWRRAAIAIAGRRDAHARVRARRDGSAPGGPRAAHHRGPLPRDGGERGGPDQRDRRHRQVRLREPELRDAAGHAGGGVHRPHDRRPASSRTACTRTIARPSTRSFVPRVASGDRGPGRVPLPPRATEAGAGSRREGAATAPRAASCGCC